MNTDDSRHEDQSARLRAGLVGELLKDATIISAPVEAAMRAIPRHLFAPEASLTDAYSPYDAVVTKWDEDGNALSSVSAPQVQAFMLEQAEITAGMRVLEIGSGGYNAALLAELVGPTGLVVTVDIDTEVTERARLLLDKAGYPQVVVIHTDAEEGLAEHAPYDRVLVTAGVWDVPPVWISQLAAGGRLLVPFRMRGLTRTLAFEHVADDEGGYLVSRSSKLFGFVPVQGRGAHQGTLVVLRGGEITLRFDDNHPVDPDLIATAFTTPQVQQWSGVTIGRTESMDTVQMWLATVAPGFCSLVIDPALDTGLVTLPSQRTWAWAVVAGDSIAYLTTRSAAEPTSVEFGLDAFGPKATTLAELMAGHLRSWDREHRGGPGPQIRIYPAGTPDARLPVGHVIDKRHSRVTISWPAHRR